MTTEKLLTLTIFVTFLMFPFANTPNANESQKISGNHECQQFIDEESRQAWWSKEYGINVTLGSLLLIEGNDASLRLGQLTLMKRELQKQNKMDYQKHMVLELETSSLLNSLFGDKNQIYQSLVQSAHSEIQFQVTNLQQARLCAFECKPGLDGAISESFMECIKR